MSYYKIDVFFLAKNSTEHKKTPVRCLFELASVKGYA